MGTKQVVVVVSVTKLLELKNKTGDATMGYLQEFIKIKDQQEKTSPDNAPKNGTAKIVAKTIDKSIWVLVRSFFSRWSRSRTLHATAPRQRLDSASEN
jgi:hypothetical protein